MISSLAVFRGCITAARTKLSLMALALLLAGCSANPIYSTTGMVLANYAEGEATPYVLQMTDAQMSCSLGEGVDPLLYSFSRVTSAPDAVGSLLMLLSANCAEYRAWEAELTYLRANFKGDVSEAKDAREATKRFNAVVAERRLTSFNRAMAAYDFDTAQEPVECPFLFNDQDELTFLLGLVTGMQAIVNDANSGAMVGVPRSIAAQAERAATCLDNEKWAGIPNAVRSMVWLLLPDTRPNLAPDPWAVLDHSVELGIEQGLRVSSALQVVAAETFGRPDVLASAIARFAESEETFEVNERYRMVDLVGATVVQFSSDKHWSANYGYRTPNTFFGKMSPESDAGAVETMSLDDLL